MVGLLHDLMTKGACISPQNGYSSLLTNFLQGEGKICDPGTVCNVHLSYPENSDSELHLVFSVGHHQSTDLYVQGEEAVPKIELHNESNQDSADNWQVYEAQNTFYKHYQNADNVDIFTVRFTDLQPASSYSFKIYFFENLISNIYYFETPKLGQGISF